MLFIKEINYIYSCLSSGLCHQQLGEKDAAAKRFAESWSSELHISDRHRHSLKQGVSSLYVLLPRHFAHRLILMNN